jgi:hypothetical protein
VLIGRTPVGEQATFLPRRRERRNDDALQGRREPARFVETTASPKSPQAIAMRAGTGNWAAFNQTSFSVHDIIGAAGDWAARLRGIERPWLCWNVNHNWCLAQQRLVEFVGWTPVIGWDPRIGPPPLTERARYIDFNERFGFPLLYPHFVIEFAFVFAARLAFWHTDQLVRKETLQRAAAAFERMGDGTMLATQSAEGRLAFLRPRMGRYWEVLGCATRDARRKPGELRYRVRVVAQPLGASQLSKRDGTPSPSQLLLGLRYRYSILAESIRREGGPHPRARYFRGPFHQHWEPGLQDDRRRS